MRTVLSALTPPIKAKTFLFLISVFYSCAAFAKGSISGLGSGPPVLMGKSLGESSYIAVKTKRLAKPKVLWINESYFEENQISVPTEEQVLEEFAWGIPSAGEDAGLFLDQEKVFYADRYGGWGNARNLGSGRAASAGRFQIKGTGKTPLVMARGEDHSNGLLPLSEGIREVIYGEANQELPYGGNRVIALIDRGTVTEASGTRKRWVMVVREDPLRAAHFMPVTSRDGKFGKTESQRLMQALIRLPDALPQPEGFQGVTQEEKLFSGIREYIDRVAKQYAAAFARKYYHGATSLSNLQLNGGFLDYGTQTAQPGYGRIRILLDNEDAAGEITILSRILIKDFVSSLHDNLPAKLSLLLPAPGEAVERFRKTYHRTLKSEFLRLTGVPDEILIQLDHTPEAKLLSNRVIEVATYGAQEAVGRYQVPERLTRFRIDQILVALQNVEASNEKEISRVLNDGIPGEDFRNLRERFLFAYKSYIKSVEDIANGRGWSPRTLHDFMQGEAVQRNRAHPELYRWKLMDKIEVIEKQYNETQNTKLITGLIESTLSQARSRTVPCKDFLLGKHE